MGHSSFGPMWPHKNPHIVSLNVDGIHFPAGIHRDLHELVTLLVRETRRRGYVFGVPGNPSYGNWGYANRPISGTKTPSNHSQGTSIDINAPRNPYSYTFKTDMPSWMPALWKRYGFRWGGDYSGKKDTMHYEFMGTVADAHLLAAAARAEFSGQTPIPPTYPPDTIRMGARGPIVVTLQTLLNKWGYGITVDGDFGPSTNHVVVDFQRKRGLAADGIVGPATWSALNNYPKPPQGDWFDMATEADLKKALEEHTNGMMVQVSGDPTGATFCLSRSACTLTWLNDAATATAVDFLGIHSNGGKAFPLDRKQLDGLPILNRAELEKAIGGPYTLI